MAKAKAKTAKRTTTKKAAPKRTSAKATATKKTVAKKSTSKTTAKKTTKKPTTKKPTTKVTKKSAPTKSAAKKTTVKKSTKTKTEEVKVDRRITAKKERRTDKDRRQEIEAVEDERREAPERRTKVARRRQIDPTTCERDYTNDEIEFMHALDEYKRKAGRMFPTCSEILEVVRGLNYRRLTPEELAKLGPADPQIEGEQADPEASDEAFAESTFKKDEFAADFDENAAAEQPPVFAAVANHTANENFGGLPPASLEDFAG